MRSFPPIRSALPGCVASIALGSLVAIARVDASDATDVTAARREAEGTHAVVEALLQAVHESLYRPDEAMPLPAAVFREAFAKLARERGMTLRWLAVDGVAMNAEHRPRDDFEREAVRRLAKGEQGFEEIAGDVYRRAGPVALGNHCLKCHVPDRKSLEDRTAGLVISLSLGTDPEAEKTPAP